MATKKPTNHASNKRTKKPARKTGYASDVTDEEWAFCAPYLVLMKEDAPQREHDLRTVFNAVRYMVRAGDDPQRSAAMVYGPAAGLAVDEGRVF